MDALAGRLLPLAAVMTPNIPEAEILWGRSIENEKQMEEAARDIGEKYGGAVLVKGGHQVAEANDVLYQNGRLIWFREKRIDSMNTHGTGCTLSSAIASNLAKGFSLVAKPGRFLGEKGFVSIKFRRISPEMDKEMSRKVLVNYKISVGDWLIKRGIYVTMKKHTRERGVGHER